jgi:phage virion morphogenesis protein
MTTTLQIDLESGALLAAIDRLVAELADSTQLMEDIGAKLESNINLRFDAKVDPDGRAWKPLSQNTVDFWYALKYPDGIPGTLLERTRTLRNSLAFNAGDGFVEIGTSYTVPGKSQPTWQVGLLHEFGTTIMPRRGILTSDPKTGRLGADDEADILAIVNSWLGGAFSA